MKKAKGKKGKEKEKGKERKKKQKEKKMKRKREKKKRKKEEEVEEGGRVRAGCIYKSDPRALCERSALRLLLHRFRTLFAFLRRAVNKISGPRFLGISEAES